ncbi:acyl-CoA dehydratase activase-related protein [Raoultibacter timonensis]|uniref:acyl-CoA dehydratase activase-related protein n=1 Tax=Raoultibacter timonensis TaxID=1907662 RepID=UPI001FD5AADE|nr:acyl-CoA dehydratase activase-related protein [Raoultibacter timonensis]
MTQTDSSADSQMLLAVPTKAARKAAASTVAALLSRTDCADIVRVGIPRALLYYRYGVLWTTFFEQLGREVVVSDISDKDTFDAGERISVDECCLASKLYLGHVQSLIGACDAVFVPSLANKGHRKGFCTKYQSLPDLVANTFYDRELRIVSLLVNETEEKIDEKSAFIALGQRFGVSAADAKRAYRAAFSAQQRADRVAARAQERLMARLDQERKHAQDQKPDRDRTVEQAPASAPRSGAPSMEPPIDGQLVAARPSQVRHEAPLAILLVAHPYVAHDPFVNGGVVDVLESMGASVLYADQTDHGKALHESFEFSETLPWIVNRELVGSVTLLHAHVDGIVLVSAFPCGPDSMTNDAVARCIQGKPILSLIVDAQSGTAGLETRIESFIDILRYQQRGGYLHG